MSQDLRELYQEVIIEHSRSPRHFSVLSSANHQAKGYNPLCGDEVTIYLEVTDNVINDISFQGCGCAISMASASLMAEQLNGKSITAAMQLFDYFHDVMTCMTSDDIGQTTKLGKLEVLLGVREFPMRIKCATLAWHTFKNALEDSPVLVTTEDE